MPGYDLSDEGLEQARAAARYLGRQPVVAIWASPLQRALRTAEPIATRSGLPVRVDAGLTEWLLMDRWAGTVWEDLPEVFPGELEAFLARPTDLSFSPERLQDLAERSAGAIRRLEAAFPHGDVVVVSHSGPLRAATLALTGESLELFWEHDPPPCSVATMRTGRSWTVETAWAPA